jgi:NAD(P)-dependent dehydrogenase (short-subunit alcohol dehydrogenase family)
MTPDAQGTRPVAAVTGGARGIGAATARALHRAGMHVAIGDLDGDLARDLASHLGDGVSGFELDVTRRASFEAFLDEAEAALGELDVLVNNAGIVGRRSPVTETTPDDLAYVYATNVLGPLRVFQAFRAALERSSNPVVVNVSSGMGSIAWTNDPGRVESSIIGLAYPSSKSALNMLTTQLARAFPGMRINAADPGYTATDFNDHRGTQTVQEGAEVIVRLAQLGPDGPTGTFANSGGAVPW